MHLIYGLEIILGIKEILEFTYKYCDSRNTK